MAWRLHRLVDNSTGMYEILGIHRTMTVFLPAQPTTQTSTRASSASSSASRRSAGSPGAGVDPCRSSAAASSSSLGAGSPPLEERNGRAPPTVTPPDVYPVVPGPAAAQARPKKNWPAPPNPQKTAQPDGIRVPPRPTVKHPPTLPPNHTSAAMLPSRGIARSLPSAGARRQIQSRWTV